MSRRLNRRRFLGGVSTGVVGLLGCADMLNSR